MDYTMSNKNINNHLFDDKTVSADIVNLSMAKTDQEYIIKEIKSEDLGLRDFLFSLGCYAGELVTVISILSGNYVINVKDARYSIDQELAEAIII